MTRILIVDDEPELRSDLAHAARVDDREVVETGNARSAITLIIGNSFDIVITDLFMDGHEAGISVLEAAKSKDSRTQVIIVTAYASNETCTKAKRLGADDFIDRTLPGVNQMLLMRSKILEALEKQRRSDLTRQETTKLGNKKLEIVISYSHKEAHLKEQIDAQLSTLRRLRKADTWHDSMIPLGSEWNEEIRNHFLAADIILLLVSANFIQSEYIWGVEIKDAMERHDKREARVIPIKISPCDWKGLPFAKLQGFAEPLSDGITVNQTLAAQMAERIRAEVEEFAAHKSSTP